MPYIFRREDNGELIEVDFETAMSQVGGYITLPDGVAAKRCVYLELERCDQETIRNAPDGPIVPCQAEILSDAMGVTAPALAEYEADRIKHGFKGIEFVPDGPYFYKCKASSWREWERYRQHRCLVDRNSKNGGGAALSPDLLQRTANMVLAAHPAD